MWNAYLFWDLTEPVFLEQAECGTPAYFQSAKPKNFSGQAEGSILVYSKVSRIFEVNGMWCAHSFRGDHAGILPRVGKTQLWPPVPRVN